MLTTSFKVWGAYAVVAYVVAAIYGYTSGGGIVGPLSLGYLGGVGDHVGYGILTGVAIISMLIGLVLTAYRDADPDAAANYLGKSSIAYSQPPVGASIWPLAMALGLGTVILGLAVHPAVFVVGIIVLVIVAFEWTMEAWADRATGDRRANRELRDRIMTPIELPAMAVIGVGLVAVALSRVLLAVSAIGAVVVASVVALAIFAIATFIAIGPPLSKRIVGAIVGVGLVSIFAAGIVSAAIGEREFEHHGGEEEHGDEQGHATLEIDA